MNFIIYFVSHRISRSLLLKSLKHRQYTENLFAESTRVMEYCGISHKYSGRSNIFKLNFPVNFIITYKPCANRLCTERSQSDTWIKDKFVNHDVTARDLLRVSHIYQIPRAIVQNIADSSSVVCLFASRDTLKSPQFQTLEPLIILLCPIDRNENGSDYQSEKRSLLFAIKN